ncbi:MAG: SAM-dependent methyltransferase [Myxococcaceae bacterium]|nr:SAM-dependent methyltransferase [Myxococcaceae bacterium]
MAEPAARPLAALLKLINGAWLTQALYVAARFRLADLLANGPLSVEELASRAGTHPQSTARLLRALAMFGVFHEEASGQFGLSPMAEHLRSDRPSGLYHWALLQGEPWHWQAWGQLQENVKTGVTAFESSSGRPLFDFLEQEPAAGECFAAAMAELSSLSTRSIVKSYDFSAFRRVVDIGGGEGILLQHLLETYPAMHGVLFDREAVLAKARERLSGTPLAQRMEYQSGSFFESIPGNADAYLLKHILHDWNDAAAGRLLRACREQLRPHARLLIVEYLLPSGDTFCHGKMLDLEMLVMCGGQERTQEEMRTLLAQNGLSLERVIPTSSGLSLIEAVGA